MINHLLVLRPLSKIIIQSCNTFTKPTRFDKTPIRKTSPNKNNNSVSKKDLEKNNKDSISINTIISPKMEKKETKRLIKPKTMSQEIIMNTDKTLSKKKTFAILNTNFSTNMRDKSIKKDKSQNRNYESESKMMKKNKSFLKETSHKKLENKSFNIFIKFDSKHLLRLVMIQRRNQIIFIP